MTKNQLGLVFGFFLAIFHAVWSLAVWLIPTSLQQFIDWILSLHHISLAMIITQFSLVKAVILVIVTFVCGYVFGWVFAWLMKVVKK